MAVERKGQSFLVRKWFWGRRAAEPMSLQTMEHPEPVRASCWSRLCGCMYRRAKTEDSSFTAVERDNSLYQRVTEALSRAFDDDSFSSSDGSMLSSRAGNQDEQIDAVKTASACQAENLRSSVGTLHEVSL